ncbi:hypothetical protein KY289_007287 [Solanum tuberosum]|nr:hypothetical protein KY289_007287 [Solanum tuberosum]
MLYFGDTAYEGNMFSEKQLGADWETENKTKRFMKELGCYKFTEKMQSCTHLYCKPCLAHVANWSRACPYDGYLVTEADSKALIESDKTLAESIFRVKVRLSLSQKWMHMGRCGVQIVHRQVHEHVLSCPTATGAATTAAGTDSNQTTVHSGTPASLTPNPQTTTASLLNGQDPNQQTNASSQALATASAGVPTSEQWYQQHHQQYYQQYAGYEPYQQQTYQQLIHGFKTHFDALSKRQ